VIELASVRAMRCQSARELGTVIWTAWWLKWIYISVSGFAVSITTANLSWRYDKVQIKGYEAVRTYERVPKLWSLMELVFLWTSQEKHMIVAFTDQSGPFT
jgi:hypothetical protein